MENQLLYRKEIITLLEKKDSVLCGIKMLDGLLKSIKKNPKHYEDFIKGFQNTTPDFPFLRNIPFTSADDLRRHIETLKRIQARFYYKVLDFLISYGIEEVFLCCSPELSLFIRDELNRWGIPIIQRKMEDFGDQFPLFSNSFNCNIIIFDTIYVLQYPHRVASLRCRKDVSIVNEARTQGMHLILAASTPQFSIGPLAPKGVGFTTLMRNFHGILTEQGMYRWKEQESERLSNDYSGLGNLYSYNY